jgi:hypothetical protein
MWFPNCSCSPSALYICEPDDSQPFHKARKISLEDANILLRIHGLQPLEGLNTLQYNHGFEPLDYGVHIIAGLELPDMEVDLPKAKATARRSAHEAQAKREKRREESQHLIKARHIPSPILKVLVLPR